MPEHIFIEQLRWLLLYADTGYQNDMSLESLASFEAPEID